MLTIAELEKIIEWSYAAYNSAGNISEEEEKLIRKLELEIQYRQIVEPLRAHQRKILSRPVISEIDEYMFKSLEQEISNIHKPELSYIDKSLTYLEAEAIVLKAGEALKNNG